MTNRTPKHAFVLATAAQNEEATIERTLSSVVKQTVLPKMWVIVSDGSTDGTDALVQSYAEAYSFIRLHRIDEPHERNFAAQANAINTGFAYFCDLDYSYIGNLDADISLQPDYFESLLNRFDQDSQLGLAGGYIFELSGGMFAVRKSNSEHSVAHGIQMFRRACFAELGGYAALPYGGPDWHAEITARRAGWKVQSFPDLKCFHHRVTGAASGRLKYCYRQGQMDYSLGSDPWFELVKLARRLWLRPYVAGSVSRLAGFIVATCRGAERPVSPGFVRYLRSEQRARLRSFFGREAASESFTTGSI
jgi:glycosyltransferase involved in cell wall biosynthesis